MGEEGSQTSLGSWEQKGSLGEELGEGIESFQNSLSDSLKALKKKVIQNEIKKINKYTFPKPSLEQF